MLTREEKRKLKTFLTSNLTVKKEYLKLQDELKQQMIKDLYDSFSEDDKRLLEKFSHIANYFSGSVNLIRDFLSDFESYSFRDNLCSIKFFLQDKYCNLSKPLREYPRSKETLELIKKYRTATHQLFTANSVIDEFVENRNLTKSFVKKWIMDI